MNLLEEVEAVSNVGVVPVGVVPNPSYNLSVSQLDYAVPGPSNSQNFTVGIETTPQSPGNPINLDIGDDPITKINGTFVDHKYLKFYGKSLQFLIRLITFRSKNLATV